MQETETVSRESLVEESGYCGRTSTYFFPRNGEFSTRAQAEEYSADYKKRSPHWGSASLLETHNGWVVKVVEPPTD